ncbi:hypothetical protein I4U23_005244 [Adineta vaga]|nr:hypothetical protein I4U23_005244 [Adineta vaga]
MPNVTTTKEDQYTYVQYQLPDEELMIIGYLPLININTAHHMLTFACTIPSFLNRSFWFDHFPCIGKQMIIHAWALNGSSLILPKDVGFPVGRNTPYKFIVINLHYLSIVKNDNSGNQLLLTQKPRQYHAGLILIGTHNIYLQPKTHTIRTNFSCRYYGSSISIFATHFHTHRWGRVNSLYRIRDKSILQIAKGNPQWPQSFYTLSLPIKIQHDDYLIGQCVYDNNDNYAVHIGPTHNDEMCNIYAMYSYKPIKTSKRNQIRMNTCWGNSASHLTYLLPEDSIIAPTTSYDITETNHNGTERISMNERKTYLLLIINISIFFKMIYE